MRVVLLLICFVVHLSVVAQTNKESKGLIFETALSWSEIKAKAKAANKPIFVDVWTTWCGPCLYMNKKVFPDPQVGAYFNRNFINVKLQLDSTAEDSEQVKSWYADAHKLGLEWDIQFFPTFVFLSPQGELLHRGVGGSDAVTFIALGKEALDPAKQFYTLKNKYDAGSRDATLLYRLAQASNRAGLDDLSRQVTGQYLPTQKTLFTKDNLMLLKATIRSTGDEGFDLFLQQGNKVDKILGKGEAMSVVKNTLVTQHLMATLYDEEGPVKLPDWKAIEQIIKQELKQIRSDYLKTLMASLKGDHLKQLKSGAAH